MKFQKIFSAQYKLELQVGQRCPITAQPTVGTVSITAGPWLAKPKRRTVPRVASDVMTSCRARRMSERRLESEDIHSSMYRVRRMAVPQLVWVDVEPGGSSPLPANISNCLACEMPRPPGTREDEIFRIAAAQLLKESKRCWRYANSASL